MDELRSTRELRREIAELERQLRLATAAKQKSETQAVELAELHRRAEEARQQTERQHRELVESVDSVILRWTPDGALVFCNRFGRELLGLSESDLHASGLARLFGLSGAAAGAPGNALEDFLRHPEEHRLCEREVLTAGGARVWIAWTVRALRNPGGGVREFLGVGNDVTSRKRFEEDLRQANAELEEANRELRAFSYTVAHDLRSPLGNISGYAQLIASSEPDLAEENREGLQRIIRACKRMSMIIQGLLDFATAAQQPLECKTVDLSALAQEIGEDLRMRHLGRRIDLEIAPRLRTQGDPRMMQIVLQNLLGNAFKYAGQKKTIRISFDAAGSDGARVFHLRDNGVGFDPARADDLFQPFTRLHDGRDFPGVGIGLATVRRIIERHGGRIWAEGRPDEGATFHFSLHPAADAPARG